MINLREKMINNFIIFIKMSLLFSRCRWFTHHVNNLSPHCHEIGLFRWKTHFITPNVVIIHSFRFSIEWINSWANGTSFDSSKIRNISKWTGDTLRARKQTKSEREWTVSEVNDLYKCLMQVWFYFYYRIETRNKQKIRKKLV